jgi:hypothetical protein
MRYTPSQLRDIVGISQETLRHWRATLAPLQGVRGHGPSFKPGQVLATAAVKAVVEECGVSVRSLTGVASALFEVCEHPDWEVFSRGRLVLQLQLGSVLLLSENEPLPSESILILISLAPIVSRLRRKLLNMTQEEDQVALNFAPISVAKNRAVMSPRRRP